MDQFENGTVTIYHIWGAQRYLTDENYKVPENVQECPLPQITLTVTHF